MMPKTAFFSLFVMLVIITSPSRLCGLDENNKGIEAITRPSKDVTVGFVRSGRVAQIHVKDGDMVKEGQLLVQLDDAVEQARLAQVKAKSEDTTSVDAAELKWKQKEVDFNKYKQARERGAATELELQYAELEAKISELSYKIAQFEHKQDERVYKEGLIEIENMRLSSPIAGRVEKVSLEVGESAEALGEVVRIVEINPLWIDVPVPLEQSRGLKTGQAAKVTFADGGAGSADGKITFLPSVADAASGTLTVRVEVPNDSGRPAGEHVRVSFTEE